MIQFTLVKDKVVLDPNIVLFKELHELYKIKRGPDFLKSIYYTYSREADNPFRDLSQMILEENVLQVIFGVGTWEEVEMTNKERDLYEAAENLFVKYNETSEARLEKSINKKLDEISTMLDETKPKIETSYTKTGEIKFNTNLNIILNLFTKIETILKGKTVLQNAIRKQEGAGKTRGGGSTSFREMGTLSKK